MELNTLPPIPDTIDYLHVPKHPVDAMHDKVSPLSLDSIFAAYQPHEVVQHISLFTHHSLQPQHTTIYPRRVQATPDWIFVLLVLLIALLSLYLNSFRVQVGRLFGSTINLREMEYFYRDNNFKRYFTILPMMLFYAATIALCLFFYLEINQYTLFSLTPWATYGVLFGLITTFFLLKSTLISLLGNIFSNLNAAQLYNSNNYIYQFAACIVLIPLLLFAFYGPCHPQRWSVVLLYTIAFAFCLRFFRGIKLILTNSTTSKFYLFYYLCTLEIVPLLILGKQIILF